jgi:hypothetical protein
LRRDRARAGLLFALLLASSTLASAQPADDPAVAVCTALAREKAGAAIEIVSGKIEGPVVELSYRIAGARTERILRCPFVRESDDTWMLRIPRSSDASRCAAFSDETAAVMRRFGEQSPEAQSRRIELKRCVDILKAELVDAAKAALATVPAIVRATYPIPASATALRDR